MQDTFTRDDERGPIRAGAMVHGMDGTSVSPTWKPIGEEDLERVARALRATAPGSLQVTWHSPRPFSAAARVRAAQRGLFVKRHDTRVRDAQALREEHRFMDHLRARGVPVPELLALFEDAEGHAYEVHALAEGADLYGDAHSWTPVRGAAHARALGAALAGLHRAARGFQPGARPVRPLLAGIEVSGAADLAGALVAFVRARPAVARFLGASRSDGTAGACEAIAGALAPWHAGLRPVSGALERIWVHNDWHASNLFWWAADPHAAVSAVIDFGLSNEGWAVADLATALERNTIAWLESDAAPQGGRAQGGGIGRPELAQALVEGYRGVRELGAAEREALPWMMALAHVEYALSEVDYFCRITGNLHDAALAHPGFLLGHVRWFEGEDGRRYLDALRECLREPMPA